jgi:hypothetical protein
MIGSLALCVVLAACGADYADAELAADDAMTLAALDTSGRSIATSEASAPVQAPTGAPLAAAPTAATGSTAPTAPTGSTGATQDPGVPAIAPASTDPRVIYWVDPRMNFSSMQKWRPSRQVVKPNGWLSETPEPGVIGANGDFTLSRAVDPLAPTKAAFRHRISNRFPTWDGSTFRSEITANWSNDGTNITRGVDYWVAWAIKLDPDMLQAGNGSASILDFHAVPDPSDTQRVSSFSMYAGEGSWNFRVNWNPNALTLAGDTQSQTLWRETNPSTSQWHKFVFKVRFHWDPAQRPYIRIWRAVDDGPLVQIASRDGPNAYNDNATFIPQKFGIYRWDAWSGSTNRTAYTKGMYVVRDASGVTPLNEAAMLALLNQI